MSAATDRWIVSRYKFKMHDSLDSAEKERDRLQAANPKDSFRVMRVKTTLKRPRSDEEKPPVDGLHSGGSDKAGRAINSESIT